jgi:hypothetical protein
MAASETVRQNVIRFSDLPILDHADFLNFDSEIIRRSYCASRAPRSQGKSAQQPCQEVASAGLEIFPLAGLQELTAQHAERERVVGRATLPTRASSGKRQFLAQVTEPQVFVIAS